MKNKENEKIMKQNTCRTIVNIHNDLDQAFREMAVKRGISKSAMIVFAMSWYLYYNQTTSFANKMLNVLNPETIANILKKQDNEE